MNFWQLANERPILTFFLVWLLTRCVFRCWNRLMRMFNIRKNGWPPPHCDADGDFPPEPDEDDEPEAAR